VGFAERLGGGSLEVVNLFGLRATDPAALLAAPEPVGEDNDRTILEAVGRAWYVIAAWGAEGGHLGRASAVMKMLAPLKDLYALRVNKDGSPGHPLYLRGDSKASLFQVRSSTP
jgi:hypothetical protein